MIREAIDQSLHWMLGYAMARSLRGLQPRAIIIAKVMEFADYREWLQHPDGDFGEGSRRDMLYWLKGAEAGAGE